MLRQSYRKGDISLLDSKALDTVSDMHFHHIYSDIPSLKSALFLYYYVSQPSHRVLTELLQSNIQAADEFAALPLHFLNFYGSSDLGE